MGLWLAEEPLVLASRSASRRAVLAGAGIPVEVLPADVDERGIEAQAALESPSQVAVLLAHAKAGAISARRPGRLVLGADQTLALGQRLFAKPADLAAASDQLKALRGHTHELHSAVVVVRDGAVLFEHCEIARLTMRSFSDRFLARYIEAAGVGRQRRASAATRWRAWAFSCSRASRATISQFLVCRCCGSCNSCGSKGAWPTSRLIACSDASIS